MRVAIISDIHGNYRALISVFQDITKQRVDEIISLGDNVGYGPEPEDVVTFLQEQQVFSIMGNHEFALIDQSYYKKLNPSSKESLDITMQLISSESRVWLGSLDRSAIRYNTRFIHGCPPDSITRYLFDPPESRLINIFNSYPEPVCFAGHTHLLNCFSCSEDATIESQEPHVGVMPLVEGRRYLFIPGSVGQPRDNVNNHAKYGIWDISAGTFELRAVPYDVDTTMKLIEKQGFPISNATRLKW